jgi:hypothetical protein
VMARDNTGGLAIYVGVGPAAFALVSLVFLSRARAAA